MKHILKFMKEWFVGLGCVLLGSVCLVITGIIGEAFFGWAVFPGSEGHVPILKFILLLLGVMLAVVIVVVGPFVVLKTIRSLRKLRAYVERLEDTIDMTYTIVYSTPDEYVKEALKDVFRYQGVGQDNQENPSSQNKVFFRPVIDTLQNSLDGDASDVISRESPSNTKPDS